MAYEKQTWEDLKTPLDAEHMNHIEDGIGLLSEENAKLVDVIGLNYPNLCNPESMTPGLLNVGGQHADSTTYKYTDYVPVKPGDILHFYTGMYGAKRGARQLCAYDAEKVAVISAGVNLGSGGSVGPYVVPDGIAFVRISFWADAFNIMINVGDKPRPYVPYGQLVTGIEEKALASNVLSGKVWIACGDSFTAGGYGPDDGFDESVYKFNDGPFAGQNIVYPFIIGARNNMTVINMAVSGMTMCNIDGTRVNSFSNEVYLGVPANADYITLKFGINDVNYSSPLGTIDDDDTTTFYGAWNVVMRHLLTNNPRAKIGIIVTNGSMQQYTDATIEIAKKWGVAYLDEVNDPTVPLLHRVDRDGVAEEVKALKLATFRVGPNNTHPNVDAQNYEASFVENWLRSL